MNIHILIWLIAGVILFLGLLTIIRLALHDSSLSATRRKVKAFLKKRNIPFHHWGQGSSKSLDELVEAVKAGEIFLPDDMVSPAIIRVSVVTIRYKNHHGWHELREMRQLCNNGHSLTRPQFNGSIGEKILKGKRPLETAIRGIGEELGQTQPLLRDPSEFVLEEKNVFKPDAPDNKEDLGPLNSEHWPGLPVLFKRNHFYMEMSRRLWSHEYREYDPKSKRTVEFRWVPLQKPVPA